MAIETVRIYAEDQNTDAIEDVLVRVYDDVGAYVTQNTTALVGSDAYCEVDIDGDDPAIEYTIRLSKTGVAFDRALGDSYATPQTIEVYSPPTAAPNGTNYFTVNGETFTRPVATDAMMCRCSGFFRDVAGRPLANLSINIENISNPIIADGDGILGSKVFGKTDSDGYFQVDLYRGSELQVHLESLGIQLRAVCIPDASSVNLIDLLFPIVNTVAYDPVSVSVAVDAYQDVAVTITDTVGNTHDLDDGDVLFTVLDETVASGQIVDGQLRITGISTGSTEVTAERADESINVSPTPTALTSLSITVT